MAVCDTPAGKYEFYGYVRHADGTLLGAREDEPQFDPAVLTEGALPYRLRFKWDKQDTTMATVLGLYADHSGADLYSAQRVLCKGTGTRVQATRDMNSSRLPPSER